VELGPLTVIVAITKPLEVFGSDVPSDIPIGTNDHSVIKNAKAATVIMGQYSQPML
jgi:hypothetical protein